VPRGPRREKFSSFSQGPDARRHDQAVLTLALLAGKITKCGLLHFGVLVEHFVAQVRSRTILVKESLPVGNVPR
jgi:hypothetical protein